jgi:hypothetical protein
LIRAARQPPDVLNTLLQAVPTLQIFVILSVLAKDLARMASKILREYAQDDKNSLIDADDYFVAFSTLITRADA